MIWRRPLRSLLFVPGSRPEFFVKASASGADALVFDLEDAVTSAMKGLARERVAAELARRTGELSFVRINHPEHGQLENDLAVLAPHAAQAVMAPKISGPADLEELDERLALHERRAGLETDAIAVLVVIESCLGLRNLFDTLRCFPRIRGAGLASAEQGDLMVDLGGQWTPGGEALAYARGKFVCEARAARSPWLIDGAFMNLTDADALETEARVGRIHGFTGKIAIHPRQVETLNRVFSPTAAEVARARTLLTAYQDAQARGRGAVKVGGMMVDAANVRWAEQVLASSGDEVV
jgi:citrate lyase subunit beta/citryl-CoA lyase